MKRRAWLLFFTVLLSAAGFLLGIHDKRIYPVPFVIGGVLMLYAIFQVAWLIGYNSVKRKNRPRSTGSSPHGNCTGGTRKGRKENDDR